MARGKILIVDEDDEVRETVKTILEYEGLDVLEAKNGEEAIKILHEEDNLLNVSVVLADMRIPQMDGNELIEFLKIHAPGIQIVTVTACADPEIGSNIMKKGIKKHLLKPFERSELIMKVKALVHHGKDFEY